MNDVLSGLAGTACLLFLTATAANAQSVPRVNLETGHYYQVVTTGPITWTAANAAVASLPCLNADGTTASSCMDAGATSAHLATITSAREDAFVDDLRDEIVAGGLGTPAQTWIGGIQDPAGSEPGGGWQWVNGEGGFPGTNGGTVFSNWNASEPNDAGNEDHMAMGRYGKDMAGNSLGWNDEAESRDSIVGYIAEWDVPRLAENCAASAGGCSTITGHTLTFEDASIPDGATLSFNSFEFLDPRVAAGTCGTATLDILGDTGIGPITAYRMKIPAYLCGSPKFVVIAVESGDLNILSGTVFVENDTTVVLPDNIYPDGSPVVCEPVITQVPFSDGDPQYQDIVVWQSTDPAQMLEDAFGAATGYPGAAGEFTSSCGSSQARVRGASYYGIGFHIDFGPGNTWAGNSAGNLDQFVALTRYKLTLLQKSVNDAKADGALGSGDYNKMNSQLKNAVEELDKRKYSGSLRHVDNFLKFVDKAKYSVVFGKNHNGEHLMRGSNVEFMLRVKVIPFE